MGYGRQCNNCFLFARGYISFIPALSLSSLRSTLDSPPSPPLLLLPPSPSIHLLNLSPVPSSPFHQYFIFHSLRPFWFIFIAPISIHLTRDSHRPFVSLNVIKKISGSIYEMRCHVLHVLLWSFSSGYLPCTLHVNELKYSIYVQHCGIMALSVKENKCILCTKLCVWVCVRACMHVSVHLSMCIHNILWHWH